jgi:uncharacterized membrane protein YdjX (TVP38/TMEM64 family)
MEMADTGETKRGRRRALIALGLVGLGAALLGGWLLPLEVWMEVREGFDATIAWVRSLGAGWFFAAFAVLPAIGFPVSAFSLTVGPLFGPILGLPTVLALAAVCMAISLSISYLLARHWLRPGVEKLLDYFGYNIPLIATDKRLMFVCLVRVTPGSPYVFQSFLLGLAKIPFGLYLTPSWVISSASVSLFIVFGDAMAQGKAKIAGLALIGVILVAIGISFFRKKLKKNKS